MVFGRSRSGLWQHQDFVRLWTGETVSVFGSLVGQMAMLFTAVIWLHSSPLAVSVLSACGIVPAFVCGLAAGVWVDRLRRRPIMIAADIGRFIALITIPVAALFGVLTIVQLCVVALATSALGVFFNVAYEAYLPTLVQREELVEGNSKLTATASVAEFASFSLSGWLVQLMRAPGAIVVDAVSFLASAFALWRIQAPEPAPAPPAERQHIVWEALEGVQLVAREPLLRSLAGASVLAMLGSNIVSVVFLLYLNRELGFSPGVLGLIFAIGGVTSLAGAYFAGRTQLFGGLGMALVLAAFMRAGGALFMPLTAGVSVLGAALLVANQLVTDPAWTFYDINAISLRQAITPHRLQGRMNASMRFVEFGAMLLGTAAGGLGGEWLGLRQMLFAAVGMQLLAACWLAVSPVRKLRTMPVAVEAVAAA